MTRWPTVALKTRFDQAAAYFLADADQMTAALWAVLQNAAEALHDTSDAEVTLTVSASVGHMQFAMTDASPGIPIGNQIDVFRPFFTTKADGTGVGLALARQIFRGHDGDLTLVYSNPGSTRFEGTVPFMPLT